MSFHERRYKSRFDRRGEEEDESQGDEKPSMRLRRPPRQKLDVGAMLSRMIPIGIVAGILWYLIETYLSK